MLQYFGLKQRCALKIFQCHSCGNELERYSLQDTAYQGLKPEQVGLEGGSFCERGQYMVLAGPVTPSESLRLSTWGLKPEQVGLEGGASLKGDSTWCQLDRSDRPARETGFRGDAWDGDCIVTACC